MPWKNGAGRTTEIAVGDPKTASQEWSWRVSIADVDKDGPFSIFPGIDRSIVVIEGSGMDLQFDEGRIVPLEPNHPLDFDGEAPVYGILKDGPIQDFNVMVSRKHFQARLDVYLGQNEITKTNTAGSFLLIHALSGTCIISDKTDTNEILVADETLIYDVQCVVGLLMGNDARAIIASIVPIGS